MNHAHSDGHSAHSHVADPHRQGGAETVKDPVCGMDVDPATSKHQTDHAGRAFHFCSDGCKAKFEADPARYLADKPEPHAETGPKSAADERAIFTCPMHPEVRQLGPGSCPICGMALEPLEVGVDAGPNPELADMTRRFWYGGRDRRSLNGAGARSSPAISTCSR